LVALVFSVLNVKIEVAERSRAVGRLFFTEFYFFFAASSTTKRRERERRRDERVDGVNSVDWVKKKDFEEDAGA